MNAAPAPLAARLAAIRGRIAAAAARAGRGEGEVVLVGAVKALPAETVAAAVALGLADLGENRVQEAGAHQRVVPRTAARWHMIGHLQRNKVGRALGLFDLVHGVDDLELADAIARHARAAGRVMPVLAEVNVSGEEGKFGVAPAGLPALVEGIAALAGLDLRGLMTVGAPVATAAEARPGFARLRALRDAAARRLGRPLPELSMGMSADFEAAVEEGATMVRVGTALFGARPAAGGGG
ncbi:MAG TPA: YggS family pyridoxal phosphate-dependent enzyme [Candidatus Eisenbacteria bacterium]|nr:YggS family pyridoxal phosphate-dependent enzyme [Candidatus Eisenbacteria bacterium]